MKSKSDATTSGVVTDMERIMTDTKPVTHVIIKTADVNASAIFILINTSPQNVKSGEYEPGCHKATNETLTAVFAGSNVTAPSYRVLQLPFHRMKWTP